jgi:hypothetical protein
MRARGILAASTVFALVLALGGLVGCSKKLHPIQNLPPETYVNIQGAVDTVNHRVHLYWYGTDPDGNVASFKYRWVYPEDPAWLNPESQDPAWIPIIPEGGTLRTDSMFTAFTGGGIGDTVVVMPRFEIYAIDNEGAADLSPAVQAFQLRNLPPLVRFTDALGSRDTTFASATVSWETIDPDGGGPGLRYRVWLDGNGAAYDSTSEQTFTVPSARFLQNGEYRSGMRTLYVQAVDDGVLVGDSVSISWYVHAPADVQENNQGRLLVIDELPTGGNDEIYDSFYRNVYSLLPEGTYEVLRPEFNPNIFRSGRDLAQTFRQFKAVLWYRGDATTVSPLLKAYQDSIGAYLDAGGKLYLDGLYLIEGWNTPGSFREDFVRRHMGSTGLYNCLAPVAGSIGGVDSTAGWNSRNGSRFRSTVYGETYRASTGTISVTGVTGGIRGFVVTDTSSVALWAMSGALTPENVGFDVPVGVTVAQGSNGRLVLLTLPVSFAPYPKPLTPLTDPVATRLLQRMLNSFGIGIPLP